MRLAEFRQLREIEAARDELAEMDHAKSRFTANVHHELRTPLTLILAPLEALRLGEYGAIPDTVQKTLRTMHVNGRRLLKLINNLLDLAKLESQQFSITRQPVDLEGLVDDVVAGASPLAERKGISLVKGAFSGLPGLNADADALDKVLVNLVGNALKFTDEGGRIEVSAVPHEEGTVLRVADTGVGLAEDQLAKVFDRFSQVDGSNTRKHEGTGIGLSLASELVGLHEGRIWAESEGLGHGATMCVWLPVGETDCDAEEEVLRDDEGRSVRLSTSMKAAEAELNLEQGAEGHHTNPGFPRPASFGAGGGDLVELERTVDRWQDEQGAEGAAAAGPGVPDEEAPEVVVAEDNPDMRQLLGHLLGREYRVRLTRNGREALAAVHERAPALVLSDVMMPEMSGTELCAALKNDPETHSIPVVLVTSKAESEMKIEGLELGADDYVTKPFHPRELLVRVRGLVRVRALQAQLAARNEQLSAALDDLKTAQVAMVHNERLAAVGELAAGIAHEVNNPVNFALNAVRTLKTEVDELQDVLVRTAKLDWDNADALAFQIEELQALMQDLHASELPDTVRELTGIIAEGLERTASLVGDLRDFAAPGGGQRARVDIAKGIESTVSLLRKYFQDRGAHIELALADALPPTQGDPGALNQVFLNLLKNAAEVFPEGGGSIQVRASGEDGWVRVDVCDDGPGIPDEVMPRLFEPFFTTKDAGEGTGLGLSISRQIIEAHGGTLEASSEPGEGATFTVRLPDHSGEGSPARS
ncbi:MAG: ATP-binding protein [Myxococcota bacterium]